MVPHGRAHWCHLANTTEPSVFGGDVALCESTTLTTCLCIITISYSLTELPSPMQCQNWECIDKSLHFFYNMLHVMPSVTVRSVHGL